MISNQELEQNLQQGEILYKERSLRGTCRALNGCGIATAALFWGFVIVAFLLPADETAANYDAIAVVLAVLFLILAGISIATIVLGIVYGVKCRKLARLKAQFARRFPSAVNAAPIAAQPISAEPQTERSAAQQEESGTNGDQEG